MRLLLKRDGMMLIWKNGHNGENPLYRKITDTR